jgi:hypothetical protein
VLAAASLGGAFQDNFLDSTVLADRVTTVRAHLERHPLIMEEQPPPSVVGRYSG